MLSKNDDAVTVGGNIPLRNAGRDIVRLQCLLQEGYYVVNFEVYCLYFRSLSCFVEFEIKLRD